MNSAKTDIFQFILNLTIKANCCFSSMERIEEKFQQFFNDCKKEGLTKAQMRTICQPIITHQRLKKLRNLTMIISLIVLLFLMFNIFESFSWILSAIGRLLLIKLLPLWNWTPLYNSKCLIWRENNAINSNNDLPPLGRYETNFENCVLCEDMASMSTTWNATFSQLETNYLERGLPVIVTESHRSKDLKILLDDIFMLGDDFLESEPCDLATNLMLKKYFNLEIAFEKIRNDDGTMRWFLQQRNCQFRAVKASRIFVSRPYYYPLHLEPFYTSWLLMSHNYNLEERRLYLQGLIFVQQLSGHFNVKLEPKVPCNEYCPVINLRLKAGESLIFSTDLWIFHYSQSDFEWNNTSIATILEFEWNL